MSAKHQRLIFIAVLIAVVALASFLILRALNQNIVFFQTPSMLQENNIPFGKPIRLGGLVVTDSVQKSGNRTDFIITDGIAQMMVRYQGLLPDLFREGQGVIAQGIYDDAEIFTATEILAKHDENYMPRELVESLKETGQWKESMGQDSMGQESSEQEYKP
ncbi:MAG: cytochrome c maturation protein CcmE [Alphaproteobacteria bacterium]|nr:cytochrome c maturation protein CcmE [Alphaproteobacteria bacterium]